MPGTCRHPRLTQFLVAAACGAFFAAAEADWVFLDGAVYTANDRQPWASAVAVREGRIAYVGDDADAARAAAPGARQVSLAGRMLMPGFVDSHMHPMAAGTRFLRCQLYDLTWPEAVLEKLRECAMGLPAGAWLRAVGLDEALLEGARPGLALLDDIAGDHPAVVTPHFANSVWVNSRALALAGIDASTPDPESGKIERGDQGEPTGVLRGEAVSPVWRMASEYTEMEFRDGLRQASALANSFGITTFSEAKALPRHWRALRAAEAAGELTLRINAALAWDEERGDEQLSGLLRMRGESVGTLLRATSVKLTVDGSGFGQGASVLDPYVTSGGIGELTFGDGLTPLVAKLDAAGFDVHLHALGSGAVRAGLDAIERAVRLNPPRPRRHHLAHIALIHPDDLPRFAALGVAADIQPLWAWLDERNREATRVLGPERAARLLPFRELFDSGAQVVAGSDWISDSMSPLYGIQVALTRRPPDGSGPAWLPEQRVTLEEMLRAYTLNGAIAAGLGDETGSIEVGKTADLIVLERDLFEVDPMELQDVKVLLTQLQGREVYRGDSWP